MAKEINSSKATETVIVKPTQELNGTESLHLNQVIDDNQQEFINSITNHPLINSVPFGGSFGCCELDDKW